MTTTIPLLNEDEVRRCVAPDDEAGFGTLATPRGRLPLHALDVHARIDGLLAEVTVSQTFTNPLKEALEATYIFPLPDRAAVTRFQMQVANRVVEGVLKERGQARQEYTQAIEEGHRAAITEEERPGVFTMRVGNLMPGESATVRLTLSGPLVYSDGEATFRFPLVVAPRYIPGIPLSGPSVGAGTASDTDAVPDASRISPPVLLPGFPNPVHLSLTVDVYPSELGISDFRSALHAVLEAVSDGGVRRIMLDPGERLNRDFILRFRVGDGAIRTALTLTPDEAGAREGTFALTLVPPVGLAQAQRPRDVIFVLDRSGSMKGWKVVAARRALARMVDTLTARDRFTVYAFDDRIEQPAAFPDLGLQAATDRNRYQAIEWLAGVNVRGGTEMAQPLSMAAHLLASGGRKSPDAPQRDRVLVLITDGQVGNEDQILHSLANDLKSVRVFALGIDQAVNAAFLRRLADLGGGACELVESEDRLDEVLDQVHRCIATPVLTGLRLEASGLQLTADTLVPSRLPDLFAGAPLQIFGRYRGAVEGNLCVSGIGPGQGVWWQSVRGCVGDGTAVRSLWARGHLRELEDRFVIGKGDLAGLEKRIVETSLRYGVLCRFTAFLAVDRDATPNAGGKREHLLQPVDVPAGWNSPDPQAAAAMAGCGGHVVPAPQPPMQDAVDLRSLRQEILRTVQAGPDMVTMGKLPQTPGIKRALEQAIEEANTLNHRFVDAEHLLLGLLREPAEQVAQVLLPLRLELDMVRREIRLLWDESQAFRLVQQRPAAQALTPPPSPPTEFDAQIEQLNQEKEAAVAAQDFEKAARLRDQADKLKRMRERVVREARLGSAPVPPMSVTGPTEPPPVRPPEQPRPGRVRVSVGYGCFTERARKVMQLANQEAQRFNHEYIGTEHLLLALLNEGTGIAANILKTLNASNAGHRQELFAHRRTILDLLEKLQDSGQMNGQERLVELGILAGKLDTLVMGLKSISTPEADRRPLEQFLATLRQLLPETPPDHSEVDRLWVEAQTVLRTFLGVPGAPAGKRELTTTQSPIPGA
jgi:Ca-activated chloride channel family protein